MFYSRSDALSLLYLIRLLVCVCLNTYNTFHPFLFVKKFLISTQKPMSSLRIGNLWKILWKKMRRKSKIEKKIRILRQNTILLSKTRKKEEKNLYKMVFENITPLNSEFYWFHNRLYSESSILVPLTGLNWNRAELKSSERGLQ